MSAPSSSASTGSPASPPATGSAATATSSGGAPGARRTREAWLDHVRSAQLALLAPERRQELEERERAAERGRKAAMTSMQAAAVGARSRQVVFHAKRAARASAAPSAASGAPPPPASAAASAMRAMMDARDAAYDRVWGSAEALSRQMAEDEDADMAVRREEEGDEAVAPLMAAFSAAAPAPGAAALPPGAAPPAMALMAMAMAPGAAEAVSGVVARDEAELLDQLRDEPKNDAEAAAKFVTFETLSEKTASVRAALDRVVGEALAVLPAGGPREAVRADMKHLDRAENMGVHDAQPRGVWFVRAMAQSASRNCTTMAGLTAVFSGRLNLVADESIVDCPVCLQRFDDTETVKKMLSCCHCMCVECFHHWGEVCGGRLVCPLCKKEDFIEAVVRRR